MKPRSARRRLRRAGRAVLAGALLAAWPALAASGVSLRAFAGAGYLLNTQTSSRSFGLQSYFDFSAGLSVRGGIVRPQLLTWSGNATYVGTRSATHTGSSSSLNNLGFGVRATLLGGSPAPVSLYASRTFLDATQRGDRTTTGVSTMTGFGGSATFALPSYPRAFLSLGRTMVDTVTGDGRQLFNGLTALSVGLSQEVKAVDYLASYQTSWSNGSWADQQYRTHFVNVRAMAPVTDKVQLILSDLYYLRLPTTDAPANPRFDTNSLAATLNWRPSERLLVNAVYSNLQAGAVAPGSPEQDQSSNAVRQTLQWEWRKGLFLTQQASAEFVALRVDQLTQRGMAQRLGGGVLWLRPASWGATSLGGGLSFGLAEPMDGGVLPAWGAHLDAQLALRRGPLTGSGTYSLVYDDGAISLLGRTFSQIVRLEAVYLPTARWRLRGFVSALGSRRDAAAVGTALRRDVQLVAEANYLTYSARLFGGLGDGLPPSLDNPVYSDGLFLPAAFNTRRSDIGLTLSTTLDRGRLVVSAGGRLAQLAYTGRDPEQEAGVLATASYALGKFRFSVEERFIYSSSGGAWYRNNLLMLRLTRDFDWSF